MNLNDFFQRPTLELAPALLGMELVHETEDGTASGIIVEVEAYMGPEDKAAHSYGGKKTQRTEVMFGPPGRAYVYFIYGMYYCFNIVSGPPGKPEAILVRALAPAQGIPLMAQRRGVALTPELTAVLDKQGSLTVSYDELTAASRRLLKGLTNGPGKLCTALAITKAQYGWDLTRSRLYLRPGIGPIPPEQVARGPRINIGYAEEAIHYPWRFWIRDNPFVSK
ncbi:MAG: 3-methyladenine DNA glycosylase [Bacillaceae bacterium G1]|nr:DNA-3-methyladenine glycosylase [Bacillota bacterium]OJF17164.1 MAG: 3-methyladenine DNA glycosylase [Bacillaceae bacterium G1]